MNRSCGQSGNLRLFWKAIALGALRRLRISIALALHVMACDNATVRLDFDNEPQPDALLRLDESVGGNSRIGEDDYIEGAPELIVEIASSSVSYDLPKIWV